MFKNFKKKVQLKKLLETNNFDYLDGDKNNLLHLLVIENEKELAQNLDKSTINKLLAPNKLNLTPYDIALYLNRGFFLDKIFDHKPYKNNFNNPSLEIELINHLNFETYEYLKWVILKNKKLLSKSKLDKEQLFLGHLYKDEIRYGKIADISINYINDTKDYGVFANSDFSKNSFIGEYIGLLRKRKGALDQKNDYLFEYLLGYETSTPFTIDARETSNLMRFVNHSDKGNITPTPVLINNVIHIVLLTTKAIKKGDELSYDYGSTYWARREDPV
jgi:uncharacterized protein